MPNPSRRPPFPGSEPWAMTPEQREMMREMTGARATPEDEMRAMMRDLSGQVRTVGYGAGGGGGISIGGNGVSANTQYAAGQSGGGGMFHIDSVRYGRHDDRAQAVAYGLSLAGVNETTPTPPDRLPRAVIRDVCSSVYETIRDRSTRTHKGSIASHYAARMPQHELEQYARKMLAGEILKAVTASMPIRAVDNGWNGTVDISTDVVVMTQEQLRDMVRDIESKVVSQCVANGWIK